MNKMTLEMAANEVAAGKRSVVNRQTRRLLSYLFLIMMDATAVSVSFLIPHLFYIGPIWSGHGVAMTLVLLPLFIGVALSHHAYSYDVLTDPKTGITRAIRSFLFCVGATIFISYALKAGAEYSRFVFFSGVIIALGAIPVFRITATKAISRILSGTAYSVVIVVDDVRYAEQPGDYLLYPQKIGFDPKSYGPYELDTFATTVGAADRVLVACSAERAIVWASILRGLAVQGEILSDSNSGLGIIGLHRHGSTQTLQVSARPLQLVDRFLKRALDLAIACTVIILLSPVFVIAAIAIRAESRGPVLFVQSRIGRDNRLFYMYKFRSMFTDMCDADAAKLTSRNDSRVTQVGKFIRRTSIDELPQIVNVLKGDMSIVGPRPHALSAKAADKLYWDVDPRYRHRHSIKPGITGLAQVRGHRGNTEKTEDLTNRLQADLEYLADWSIWRDIKIVFQTIGVLRHTNAF